MIIHILMNKAGMDEISMTMSENAATVLMDALAEGLLEANGEVRIVIHDVNVTEVINTIPHYVHREVSTMQ
jgi:hypothetical protein